MPDSASTADFIEWELAAPLEQLEAERREALADLKSTRRRLKIGAVVFPVVAMFVVGFFGLIIGSFLAFAGYLGLSAHYQKRLFAGELRDRFKREVIRPLVSHAAPSTTYQADGHIPLDVFQASGMFQVTPRRYGGDDLVEGFHGDVSIRFSELNVDYTDRSTEKSSSRKTAFKGLFFTADFHKHFNGFTIVRPRRPKVLESYFSGSSRAEKMNAGLAFGETMTMLPWSPSASPHGRLEEVELEDAAFAEHFHVYSTDQVEARYILSPSMMERLLDFRREAVRARKELSASVAAKKKFFHVVDEKDMESGMFYVSFAHSNLYVAKKQYRDLFEIDPKRPLTDRAVIEGYVADLQSALGIVEDLNLNTRIWSKVSAGK